MTIQLDLPADVVARLKREAQENGLSLDQYLLRTILGSKPSDAAVEDEVLQRQRREQAGQSIREFGSHNILGPDLSARDLIEEGRRF
jgi:hypothetical protein